MPIAEKFVLTEKQIARAESLRDRLIKQQNEVVSGQRKRPRAIKVAIALSERCDMKGIEGSLVAVSTTGAIISVRDAATKQVIDVPNTDIEFLEYL